MAARPRRWRRSALAGLGLALVLASAAVLAGGAPAPLVEPADPTAQPAPDRMRVRFRPLALVEGVGTRVSIALARRAPLEGEVARIVCHPGEQRAYTAVVDLDTPGDGDRHRAWITFDARGVHGWIGHPRTELALAGPHAGAELVDVARLEARVAALKQTGQLREPRWSEIEPPTAPAPADRLVDLPDLPCSERGAVRSIRIALVHGVGLARRHGEGTGLRLRHLVAMADDILREGGTGLGLELAHVAAVEHEEGAETLPGLLCGFTEGRVAGDVEALRDREAADLAFMVLGTGFPRGDRLARGASCGRAWIAGKDGAQPSVAHDARFGYGVVIDGWIGDVRGLDGRGSTNLRCPDWVLAHELGHSLGAQHLVGHDGGDAGAAPWARPRFAPGRFATLMTVFESKRLLHRGAILDRDALRALERALADEPAAIDPFLEQIEVETPALPMLSNPRLRGCPDADGRCGDATTADDARAVAKVGEVVACFRGACAAAPAPPPEPPYVAARNAFCAELRR
ncbi:MAG: hypothetical protein H6982_06330 [Chromatiales bacterium]|nr:hypothetical protein [Chromatiales bacterium]